MVYGVWFGKPHGVSFKRHSSLAKAKYPDPPDQDAECFSAGLRNVEYAVLAEQHVKRFTVLERWMVYGLWLRPMM